MIRAYDDYGNVVDLVEWENETYNKALDTVWINALKYDEFVSLEELDQILDALRRSEKVGKE